MARGGELRCRVAPLSHPICGREQLGGAGGQESNESCATTLGTDVARTGPPACSRRGGGETGRSRGVSVEARRADAGGGVGRVRGSDGEGPEGGGAGGQGHRGGPAAGGGGAGGDKGGGAAGSDGPQAGRGGDLRLPRGTGLEVPVGATRMQTLGAKDAARSGSLASR